MKFTQVKKVQLICCGQGFNKEYQGHYNRYKVLVDSVPIEKLYTEKELKELPYWVNRSRVMAMVCWGMSQEFEATLKLGAFLFGQYKQGEEWSEYSRRTTEKIEVIY